MIRKMIPLRSVPHELIEGAIGLLIVLIGSIYLFRYTSTSLDVVVAQLKGVLYHSFAYTFGQLPDVLEVYLYHAILSLSFLSVIIFFSSVVPLHQSVSILKQFFIVIIMSQIFLTPLKLFTPHNQPIVSTLTCQNIDSLVLQTESLLKPFTLSTFFAPQFLSPTGSIQIPTLFPMIKHGFDVFADYFMWHFTNITCTAFCTKNSPLTIFLTILSTTVWFYLFGNFYITPIKYELNTPLPQDHQLQEPHHEEVYKDADPNEQFQPQFQPPHIIFISGIRHIVFLTIMISPIYLMIFLGQIHPLDMFYSILIPILFIWTDRYSLENLYCNSMINFVITHPEQYDDFFLSHKGQNENTDGINGNITSGKPNGPTTPMKPTQVSPVIAVLTGKRSQPMTLPPSPPTITPIVSRSLNNDRKFYSQSEAQTQTIQVGERQFVQRPVVTSGILSGMAQTNTPSRSNSFQLNASPEPPNQPLPPIPVFKNYVDESLFEHEKQTRKNKLQPHYPQESHQLQHQRPAYQQQYPTQLPLHPQQSLPPIVNSTSLQPLALEHRSRSRHVRSSSNVQCNELQFDAINNQHKQHQLQQQQQKQPQRVSSRRMSISRPNLVNLDDEIMARPSRTRSKTRKLDLDMTL